MLNGRQSRSFFEAMIANMFWGFGFTATIWALQGFTISQILFLRFAIVGLCGVGWALIATPHLVRQFLPQTFLPGIFLVMEVLFQVWGLQYTTATNAGFLTVTYVIMVPLLEKILWKREILWTHWLWVALSLVGTVIMLGFQSLTLNIGDVLILLSALGASLHMLSIDSLGKAGKNLFFANTMQSLWGALILWPLLVFKNEAWTLTTDIKPWIGLASITFGSTMLAFYFQMRAQRTLSPSISSLLFLVESPIAAGFGYVLLEERMSPLQWLGCLLVFIAAAGVAMANAKISESTPEADSSDPTVPSRY